jgi:hypothetical protein
LAGVPSRGFSLARRSRGRLDDDALSALGRVLNDTETLLRRAFSPHKVIFAKLGFSPGWTCHFHAIPVTAALLAEIAAHPGYADAPDGNDAMLFVSRVYCERALDEMELPRLTATVAMLRTLHAGTSRGQSHMR